MDKIICIEGCDGTGKSTQIALLREEFEKRGIKHTYIKFPVYEDDSSHLVRMYLSGKIYDSVADSNVYAATLFYACDRHIASIKRLNNFEGNGVIICDRYIGSNSIHQMSKLDKSEWDEYLKWQYDLECNKLGLKKPDLVIYLDIDAATSDKLMTRRYESDESKKDLHESDIEYLRKCRVAGNYVANKEHWSVIKCDLNGELRSIEDIHKEIMGIVYEYLK